MLFRSFIKHGAIINRLILNKSIIIDGIYAHKNKNNDNNIINTLELMLSIVVNNIATGNDDYFLLYCDEYVENKNDYAPVLFNDKNNNKRTRIIMIDSIIKEETTITKNTEM